MDKHFDIFKDIIAQTLKRMFKVWYLTTEDIGDMAECPERLRIIKQVSTI